MLGLAELRSMPVPDPLIDGLLDLDTVGLIYGRRGGHKTFLTMDFGLSVAYGNPWNGHAVTSGPVLYIAGEGVHGVAARIDAWKEHHRETVDTDRFLVLPEAVSLMSPDSSAQLAITAEQLGARMVIFDTLARCMVGGDENSAKDAGIAIEQLDLLRRRTGACCVAVHHAGKAAENGARGSSAIEAAADSVFEITSTDGIVQLRCTKQKHHAETLSITLRAVGAANSIVLAPHHETDATIGDSEIDTLAALVEMEVPGGVAAGVWMRGSNCQERTFYRVLKKLLTANLVENIGSTKMPRYQATDAATAITAKALT